MSSPAADQPQADERLLARLRGVAARLDPVPSEVSAAALASLSWGTIDAELAALTYDSVLEEPLLAGVRGATALRSLVFETAELTIEIEVSGADPQLALRGQVAPGRAAAIEVRQPGRRVRATADALGRFSVGGLRRGPTQLRCGPAGTSAVVTDWVAI